MLQPFIDDGEETQPIGIPFAHGEDGLLSEGGKAMTVLRYPAQSSLLDLPEVRPSFLDPDLICEPWIDDCYHEQTLVLFILNRPIALMPGSSLDHVSLATLLDQIRHRAPRQAG